MTSKGMSGDLEQRALELLPWYVNGTLEGEERELVGRQVLASLTCRKEFERLRRLQQLIQRDDPEAAATDREFERLMARIHASDAPPRLSSMRFGLAASMAAAVGALLWWGTLTPSAPPHTYETLTNPAPADPAVARLRVLFAPGVSGGGAACAARKPWPHRPGAGLQGTVSSRSRSPWTRTGPRSSPHSSRTRESGS